MPHGSRHSGGGSFGASPRGAQTEDGSVFSASASEESVEEPVGAPAVIEYLLGREYLMTAFELLQELEEAGHAEERDTAAALRAYFENTRLFPPEDLRRFQNAEALSLASMAREREERLSVAQYELRVAREDLEDMRDQLEMARAEAGAGGGPLGAGGTSPAAAAGGPELTPPERRWLNCAVRDYLTSRGYKLTSVTLREEVADQDVDTWPEPGPRPREPLLANLRVATSAAGMAAAERMSELEDSNRALTARVKALEASLAAESERTKAAEKAAAVATMGEALNKGRRRSMSAAVEPTAANGGVLANGAAIAAAAATASPAPAGPPGPADLAVRVMADALPKILPNVLLNKRDELLPVFLVVIQQHPDATTREALMHALFNLIKKPDEAQRRVIIEGVAALAAAIGELRTEEELLPQCWDQLSHKAPERRALVAASCGALARHVRGDLRGSLVLSILQQLAGDEAPLVREAAVRNLALAVAALPGHDKYAAVEELYFRFGADTEPAVADACTTALIPAIVRWLCVSDRLHTGLLPATLARAAATLQKAAPAVLDTPGGAQGPPAAALASLSLRPRALSESEAARVCQLLLMAAGLLPALRVYAVRSHPTAPLVAAAGDDDPERVSEADAAALLDAYAAQAGTAPAWPAIDWAVGPAMTAVVELAKLLGPAAREDGARRALCLLLRGFCRTMGEACTEALVRPRLAAAAGVTDAAVAGAVGRESLVAALATLAPKGETETAVARACVLPLYLAGVLPCGTAGALAAFMRAAAGAHPSGNAPLVSASELASSARFLCLFEEQQAALFTTLRDLQTAAKPAARAAAAQVWSTLAPCLCDTERGLVAHVIPALLGLSTDRDEAVQVAAVEGLQALAVICAAPLVVDLVTSALDAGVERATNPLYEAAEGDERPVWSPVTLALARAAAGAGVAHTAYQDWAAQKLLALTRATATAGGPPDRRRALVAALAAAWRALDGCPLAAGTVTACLLPGLHTLLQDAQRAARGMSGLEPTAGGDSLGPGPSLSLSSEPPLLEPSVRAHLEFIIRDRTPAVGGAAGSGSEPPTPARSASLAKGKAVATPNATTATLASWGLGPKAAPVAAASPAPVTGAVPLAAAAAVGGSGRPPSAPLPTAPKTATISATVAPVLAPTPNPKPDFAATAKADFAAAGSAASIFFARTFAGAGGPAVKPPAALAAAAKPAAAPPPPAPKLA